MHRSRTYDTRGSRLSALRLTGVSEEIHAACFLGDFQRPIAIRKANFRRDVSANKPRAERNSDCSEPPFSAPLNSR